VWRRRRSAALRVAGSDSVIEATDLCKRYGDTVAVDGLSFTVPSGQVTGFLGPNGCGKSTTMRLILGLDAPTSGSVTVNGQPYTGYDRPLLEVGALLDAHAVHGGRSAYNHLLCLALSNGIRRSRVDEVLEMVGLRGVANRRVGGFSLGMSQRLGIAAALLGDPSVLIFDEPVNGLDPEGVLWLRKLLKSLAAEGRTVLLSSHLMSEMSITADRLIIIGRGRLIAQTSVADLLAHSSGSFVRVRSPQASALAAVLEREGAKVERESEDTLRVTDTTLDAVGDVATANAFPLRELSAHEASLEETYMQLTRDLVDYHAGEAAAGARS
jgi:ABC-2 type transport system ATP-binding protein